MLACPEVCVIVIHFCFRFSDSPFQIGQTGPRYWCVLYAGSRLSCHTILRCQWMQQIEVPISKTSRSVLHSFIFVPRHNAFQTFSEHFMSLYCGKRGLELLQCLPSACHVAQEFARMAEAIRFRAPSSGSGLQ